MSNEKGVVHRQQGTFGKSPVVLLTDASISDGAARLYAYMHWRYGSNKNNHEGRESMAEALGRSSRTISNYLHELEQSNWIVILYRKSSKGRATSFYHVFETQDDCKAWRVEHKKPKPERENVKSRKGRAGIGGKPTHKDDDNNVNSSSATKPDCDIRNSSSATLLNSSSDNPDTYDPDTVKDSLDKPKPKDTEPHGTDKPDGPEEQPKTKTRTPAQQRLDDMINAIADAFGYDHAPVTDIQWDEFRASGKQLLKAGAKPTDMKFLYAWCKNQGWSSWTSMAMAKNWSNYVKARDADAKRVQAHSGPTAAQKAEAALYGGTHERVS